MSEPSPLVAATVTAVRQRIAEGVFAAGSALPSERQLASDLGVSRNVVREALGVLIEARAVVHLPRCRPVVSDQAAELVRGPSARRHVVLWLWPHASDYTASMILRGMQRTLTDPAFDLVVASASGGNWRSTIESEAEFLDRTAADAEVGGAVLWYLGHTQNLPALRKVREAGVHLVFVDRLPPKGFEADFIGTDNRRAAREVVQHLVDMGHRRIACVSNLDRASSVLEREAGYLDVLKANGIAHEDAYLEHVGEHRKGYRDIDARSVLERLFALPEPPTALFAINDANAYTLLDGLAAMGLSVPEDISLVGFDDVLRWVPGVAQLTSAHQMFDRFGEIAGELVTERIKGEAPSAFRHVLLDAPLRLRGSVAEPKESAAHAIDVSR